MAKNTDTVALEAFQRGRSYYQQRNFQDAQRQRDIYRSLIDYTEFEQHDNRDQSQVPYSSIIIVSYADNHKLLDCLAQLDRQEDKNFEVIIVDNGHNDAVEDSLERFAGLVIRAPINLLPSEGRNLGAFFARGRNLIFLDSDAFIHPTYVRTASTLFKTPYLVAARGRILTKHTKGPSSPHYDLGLEQRPATLNVEGNMVIRKQDFSKVEGFDPLMYGYEGEELTLRLLKLYPERALQYSPDLVISHDFAQNDQLKAKLERHQQGLAYIAYLNDISAQESAPQPTVSIAEHHSNDNSLAGTSAVTLAVQGDTLPMSAVADLSILIWHTGDTSSLSEQVNALATQFGSVSTEYLILSSSPEALIGSAPALMRNLRTRVLALSSLHTLKDLERWTSFDNVLYLRHGEKNGFLEQLKATPAAPIQKLGNNAYLLKKPFNTLSINLKHFLETPLHYLAPLAEAQPNHAEVKKRILFVGPKRFREDTGLKNVRLIYPSLLEPLAGCEFHLLHGKRALPSFVRELTDRYGVQFHQVKEHTTSAWVNAAIDIVDTYDIDILTNVFHGYELGYYAALAAKLTDKQAVVRFPANPIYCRERAGEYEGPGGQALKAKEREQERAAAELATRIVAISPWELKRIQSFVSNKDKVDWCIRGISTDHYQAERADRKKATKFIFAGRAAKEKGYHLIEQVADDLKHSHPDIEFYFAGQFDVKKEGNRTYVGYCTPEKLKQVYQEVDALILPSESEGFANVIIESMAMGLPCIITRDLHDSYFVHKENALLIELTAKSLKENLLLLHEDTALFDKLKRASREHAVRHFDHAHWGKRYRELILGSDQDTPSRIATDKPLKMLYLSPRPYGLIATPGTYLMAEGYNALFDYTLVCSPRKPEDTIVHEKRENLKITELDLENPDNYPELMRLTRELEPDIVCIPSWTRWHEISQTVLESGSKAAIVLEVKSPIFVSGKLKARRQARYLSRLSNIDMVITPTRAMAETWFNTKIDKPLLEHRQLIDSRSIRPKVLDKLIKPRKFIYTGTLHPKRNLAKLLFYISELPKELLESCQFDFYGDGEAKEGLKAVTKELRLEDRVRFMGAYPQKELFEKYRDYDAGLAWVPAKLFNDAPSLKLLEYCASGLVPIATKNQGHKLLSEKGFNVVYFDETQKSFCDTIATLAFAGYNAENCKINVKLAKHYDYKRVTRNEIYPFYKQYIERKVRNEAASSFIHNTQS